MTREYIPYDNTAAPLAPEPFSLDQVIEEGIRSALLECRVAFPASVTQVHADGSVDLQPLLNTRFVGQAPTLLPQLLSIPVAQTQGQTFRIQTPTSQGDTGYALVMDRDIDAWIASDGSAQTPQSDRAHYLSDAIFMPMLTTAQARKTDAGTDLIIENGALQMRLEKSGRLKIRNGSQEFVSVLDNLLQTNIALMGVLQQLTCLAMTGPAPLLQTSVAAIEQIKQQLLSIRANADTFLG